MSLAGSFISDSGSSSGNSLAIGPAPPSIGGMPPMQLFTELSLMEKQQNTQQQQQIQLLEALLKASLLPPSLPQTLKQVGHGGIGGGIDGSMLMAEARQLHSNSDGSDTQQQHAQSNQQRKRRRLIGNMDNTLDGLVAKRAADHTPIKKRYQTETEAIELPDDEVEIKRMEADPDVCTRMCSVCGYQGKWVSEMIRHKRVHTSERPFKCKYCNRTSKWKADLIRHVAKTHGIRVVSKYSRSKAFEMGKQGGGGGGAGDDEATELTTTTADMDDVIILGSSSSFSSSSSDCGGSGHSTNGSSSGAGGNWHHHQQHQDENNNSIGAAKSPIEGTCQVNPASNVDSVGGGAGTVIHQAHQHHSENLNSQYRKAQRLLNSSIVAGGGRCQENGQKNHHHRTNTANNNGAIHHHQQQKHPELAAAVAPTALAGGAAAAALPSLLNFLGISQHLAATSAAGPLNPLNLLTAQLLMMENHHQQQRQQKERQQMAEEQQEQEYRQQKSGKSCQQKSEYKCALCPYEQLSFPLLVSHLHAAHGVAPFICQNCNGSFNDLVSAAEHFAQFTACLPMALKSNFALTTASEDADSEQQQIDNTEPVVNGRFQSHSLINSMMPFSKLNPAAASAIAAASLFPSFASAALQFPHPANGLLAESLKNRPDCGSSPISILSNAASYSSLNSMEKTTEKQRGFKPSFTPSDADLPSTVPVTNASASSRNRNQSSEIKEEREMDEEDDDGGLLPSETETEEQQHQKQQRNAVDDRKLHLGQLGQSAFTPVIHPSLCSAPGIIQGEQCAAPPPCFTAATSLVAFGQLLAELQKHALLTHQRNQQQPQLS